MKSCLLQIFEYLNNKNEYLKIDILFLISWIHALLDNRYNKIMSHEDGKPMMVDAMVAAELALRTIKRNDGLCEYGWHRIIGLLEHAVYGTRLKSNNELKVLTN